MRIRTNTQPTAARAGAGSAASGRRHRARGLEAAFLGGAMAVATLAAGPAQADDKPATEQTAQQPAAVDMKQVVARVNGREIRMQDVAEEMRSLPPQAQQMPQAMLIGLVLDNVISAELVAQAADAAGVDETEAFAEQMAQRRRKLLTQLYLQDLAEKAMTDEALAAAYEAKKAEFGDREEVRARHILVESEEEAKKIIAELDAGKDFAEAAQEHSIGPSKSKGGDLGFFEKEQMVPSFSEAAFALEPGSYTESPVQTQFGWHVIKTEERRKAAPPSLEELRPELRQEIVQDAIAAEIDRLKETAQIERMEGAPPAPGAAQ